AAGAARLSPQDPAAATVFEEAARAFEQALVNRPSDPWILYNAAIVQSKKGNWGKAEDYCVRAAAGSPSLSPYVLLGNLYLQQGLLERAAAEFQRADQKQPGNAAAYEGMGRILAARGDFQDALAMFNAAQLLRPEWLVPPLRAGYACLSTKQPDKAIVY